MTANELAQLKSDSPEDSQNTSLQIQPRAIPITLFLHLLSSSASENISALLSVVRLLHFSHHADCKDFFGQAFS